MLEFGIDEITIVLQLPFHIKHDITAFEWRDFAEQMIYEFEEKADFKNILGEKLTQLKNPQGYTISYTYGEHNFYLAVGYHEYQKDMGVIVKFSAQALEYYLENTDMQIYEFLNKIKSTEYSFRTSRVDLTADFIDLDINISNIYNDYIKSRIAIFREYFNEKKQETEFRKVNMNFSGILNGEDVSTIYVGSKKSKSFLRIYDKKKEQIDNAGSHYNRAIKCKNWTRFEMVLRDEYAHQCGHALLEINNTNELSNLIACSLIQKFRFMYVNNGVIDCDTEYTELILDAIINKAFILKANISRNYDLLKSIKYFIFNSGGIPTLYKIKEIWGDDALLEFITCILEHLETYVPNDDCRNWLYRNLKDYRKSHPNFINFIKDDILSRL